MPAEKETGAGDVTDFGFAAVVTGSLVENKKLPRSAYADGRLRTCLAERTLRADSRAKFVDARLRTCVDGKRCAAMYLYCAFSAV